MLSHLLKDSDQDVPERVKPRQYCQKIAPKIAQKLSFFSQPLIGAYLLRNVSAFSVIGVLLYLAQEDSASHSSVERRILLDALSSDQKANLTRLLNI